MCWHAHLVMCTHCMPNAKTLCMHAYGLNITFTSCRRSSMFIWGLNLICWPKGKKKKNNLSPIIYSFHFSFAWCVKRISTTLALLFSIFYQVKCIIPHKIFSFSPRLASYAWDNWGYLFFTIVTKISFRALAMMPATSLAVPLYI